MEASSGDSLAARAVRLIESGQLLGVGLGFIMAEAVRPFLRFRQCFWLLGVAGAIQAVVFWRLGSARSAPPRVTVALRIYSHAIAPAPSARLGRGPTPSRVCACQPTAVDPRAAGTIATGVGSDGRRSTGCALGLQWWTHQVLDGVCRRAER